jgi:hypothetical protein
MTPGQGGSCLLFVALITMVPLFQSCGEPAVLRQRHTVRQLEYLAFALEMHKVLNGHYPARLEEIRFIPGWIETSFESPSIERDQWGHELYYSTSVIAEPGSQAAPRSPRIPLPSHPSRGLE